MVESGLTGLTKRMLGVSLGSAWIKIVTPFDNGQCN